MDVSAKENLPPPPGIINSIKSGFDLIANNIVAILPPFLLNLFLWLGPRLRMDALFDLIKADVITIWKSGGIPAADIQRAIGLYEAVIPNINLFWTFRTFPIGISCLFLPQENLPTPLGNAAVWQVGAAGLPGWIFLLTLLGWVGGGLYFRSIALLAQSDKSAPPLGVFRAIVQTILVSFSWGLLSLFIGAPIFMILAIILQLNSFLANLLMLIFSLMSMWAIVPLFFWSHGIFLKRQNAFASILSSFQMARLTLPMSSLFVLTIFLLSFGLNFLWSIPPEDSWMTLVGILGHSFVATALLASSFVYYRDTSAWLPVIIEKIKPNLPRQI